MAKIKIVIPPISEVNKVPPVGTTMVYTVLKEAGYDIDVLSLDMQMYCDNKKLYDFLLDTLLYFKNQDIYFNIEEILTVAIRKQKKLQRVFLLRYIQWIERYLGKVLEETEYVLIPVHRHSLIFGLILSKLIKLKNDKIKLILGGPECTANKKFCSKFWFVDFVVYGEGEITIKELISALTKRKDVSKINGIIYKDGENRIVITPAREEIADLDTLPTLDYSVYDLDKYPDDTLFTYTCRGCPYNCAFCWTSLWKKYRLRSPERIVQEIKILLGRYGAKKIAFSDDLVNGSKKHFKEMCSLIIKETLRCELYALTKPKNLDEEALELAKEAGFVCLYWGIESGSQKVLDTMRKEVVVKEMENILKMSQDAGIKNYCSFIVGYPTESEEDFQETLQFVRRNKDNIDYATCNQFNPNKLSDYYEEDRQRMVPKKEISKRFLVFVALLRELGIKDSPPFP